MIDGDRKPEPHPPTLGAMARLVGELRGAGEPITLAINGRCSIDVAGEGSVRRLLELVDYLETVAILNERLQAPEGGGPGISLDDFRREMHREHGTPL